jgi:hypothetical protein
MSDQSTPLADSTPRVGEFPQSAGTVAPSPNSGTQQQSAPPANPTTQQPMQTVPAADPSTPPADPSATHPATETPPDQLLADRQRYWYGFTKATQAVILAVVVVLALLAFFLL